MDRCVFTTAVTHNLEVADVQHNGSSRPAVDPAEHRSPRPGSRTGHRRRDLDDLTARTIRSAAVGDGDRRGPQPLRGPARPRRGAGTARSGRVPGSPPRARRGDLDRGDDRDRDRAPRLRRSAGDRAGEGEADAATPDAARASGPGGQPAAAERQTLRGCCSSSWSWSVALALVVLAVYAGAHRARPQRRRLSVPAVTLSVPRL